jgi:hypothetical protein
MASVLSSAPVETRKIDAQIFWNPQRPTYGWASKWSASLSHCYAGLDNSPPGAATMSKLHGEIRYFVKRFADKVGKHIRKIEKRTLDLCQAYHWPGNIRELQNIVERSVILSSGATLQIDGAWLSTDGPATGVKPGSLTETLLHQERKLIEAALAESQGKRGPNGAAVKLGIPPSTLDSKISQLKIRKTKLIRE